MSSVDLVPALLVVVPILTAAIPIALGLRFERTGWPVALLTCSGLFVATVYLATVVYGTGETVIHHLGGFERPVGIELVADEFSTMIALLVTATALGVLAYTRAGGPRGNTFYSAYLLLTGGLLGLTMTGDVFNMFVFLEITGLATYALIASGDGPESAVAALKYLILGTLGASVYLIGVGLVFMATGTLNMIDLSTTIPALAGNDVTLARAGLAFIVVGFAVKVAQWPLHTWQPDAYQHAPDGVTPLIAALVSTVSAYALGRVLFTAFGVEFVAGTPYAAEIIVTVGSVSVVAGSTLAVIQRDVKRMLAYSSVSQFGLIVAAYGLLTETALVGAIVHLIGHGLLKAGLFLAVGVVALGYGARTVSEYAGLANRRPVAAAAIAVMLIALVGIPPSIGFIGKWYIAVGAVEAGVWPVAAVIFLSTMLTLAYVARLLELAYFTPARAGEHRTPTPGAVVTDGGEEGDDSGRASTADANGTGTTDLATDGPVADDPATGGHVPAGNGSGGHGTPNITDDLHGPVTVGMVVLLVAVAVIAVILGFAGGPFFELLDPFVSEVFDG